MRDQLRTIRNHPLTWIVCVMLALGAVMTVLSPYFLTTGNLSNLMKQVAIVAILAAGQTVVIISGGIDLSVGSVLALSAVTTGSLIDAGYSPGLAAAAGIFVGTLCGLINGVVISHGKIAPFIATLGMLGIARGMALVITKGVSYMVLIPFFDFIGSGTIVGIPVPIIIVAIVFVSIAVMLKKTVFGRYIYAIGNSAHIAKLGGINVAKNQIIIYTLSGFLASVAAMIMIGRLASTPPHVAQGAELQAIAAVIIGGTSFAGGSGGVGLTLVGAMIMAMITNGLNILGVSSYWQQVFIGLIIIAAVWFDRLKARR